MTVPLGVGPEELKRSTAHPYQVATHENAKYDVLYIDEVIQVVKVAHPFTCRIPSNFDALNVARSFSFEIFELDMESGI